MLDLRPLELAEELARVGRERLDVATLTLGVDRVEGQRGLAGSRHAGNGCDLIMRNLQRNVLEIVLPGSLNNEIGRLIRMQRNRVHCLIQGVISG